MKGIFNKPWLALDALLPLHLLDEEQINIELATATKHSNSYGKGFARDMTNYLTCPVDASPAIQQFYERNANNPAAITEFAKLHYKALAPTRVVRLAQMHPCLLTTHRLRFQHLVGSHEYWTPIADMFPCVWDFIQQSNVFESTGRIHFLLTDAHAVTPEHIDSGHPLCGRDRGYRAEADREFLWIKRTQPKHFYVLDDQTGVRHEVTSQAAWFNTYDLHGGDGNQTMTWSLRIDGIFSDGWRRRLAEHFG